MNDNVRNATKGKHSLGQCAHALCVIINERQRVHEGFERMPRANE
jgi:hypothetical protein